MTRTALMAEPPDDERRQPRPPLNASREAPFTLRASEPDEPNDGLTLDGYGAVFGRETVIDSWEGRFREKIAPGAMKRSFRETPPKVQFDHGRHPMIGSIPIAELRSISEDVDPVLAPEGGAHVVARLFDNWLMQPVRDAIAGGAVNGMSFRFSVVREAWTDAAGKAITDERKLQELLYQCIREDVPDDELPVRTLRELKVPEIGPVTWPAYSDTSVSVRSQVIDLGRLHEPEQRKLLARAVFLADAAESEEEDAQRDTPVVEHPSQEALDEVDKALAPFGLRASDAQRDAETAVEHPSEKKNDAQRSTPAVGERPSKPRGRRPIDVMLRRSRDNLLTINHEGKKL